MAIVPNDLNSLKYSELQQLAKQFGIKANMKVYHLRCLYRLWVKCGLADRQRVKCEPQNADLWCGGSGALGKLRT